MEQSSGRPGLWSLQVGQSYRSTSEDQDYNFNVGEEINTFDVYRAELGAENFEHITSFLEEQAMLLDTRLDFIAIEVLKPFLEELANQQTTLKDDFLELFNTIEDSNKPEKEKSKKLKELRLSAEKTNDMGRILENIAMSYRFASNLGLEENVFLFTQNIFNLYFKSHPKSSSWDYSIVEHDFWILILEKRNEQFREIHKQRLNELERRNQVMSTDEMIRWQSRFNISEKIYSYLNQKASYSKDDTFKLTSELITASFKETIERNLKLVIYTVGKLLKGSNVNFGEIVQGGNLGLVKVIARIDPREKKKLGSYAVSYIVSDAVESIRLSTYTITLPTYFTDYFLKDYRKKLQKIEQEAEETTFDPKEIIELITQDMGQKFLNKYHRSKSILRKSEYLLLTKILNLEDFVANQNSGYNIESEGNDVHAEPQALIDIIPDPSSLVSLEDVVISELLSSIIRLYIEIPNFEAFRIPDTEKPHLKLEILSDKEKYVLTFKYGLSGQEKNLAEICYGLGIADEKKVKAIERSALKKIRESVLMPLFLNLYLDHEKIDIDLARSRVGRTLIKGIKIP